MHMKEIGRRRSIPKLNRRLEVLQLVQRARIRGAPAASGLPPGCRVALIAQLAADSDGRDLVRCIGRRGERHAWCAARANPGVLVLAVIGTAPPRGSGPTRPRRCSRQRRSQLRRSRLRRGWQRRGRQRRGRFAGCVGCV
eukprot:scaffold111772_cov54-Phaeocystis_antarctica.AAC.4